ncbi:recombinase family protein [Flavobacteriaceae bacterium]|nr:recombinase family protein [Flavobacteriaceae bacterium]
MLAIYTRLSKEDKVSTSITNQTREGKEFALNNNLKYTIYNEGEGVSGGADIKDRPQLNRLLLDIRNGDIKAIWFRNQNRLERNSATYVIFISEAKKYNVDVYFNDKLHNFDNPSDNLLGNITSAVNQYQRDLQASQTKRTLKDNVRDGKVWSVVAYGYKSDNGYLAINKEEAKVVKDIFKMSLSGKGTNSIANYLNDKGVSSRKGKLFRGKTIQGVIKNTIYKGKRLYSNEYYDCPKIIEPDLWQKVNDNLKNNRNNSGKKVDHKYLLKGLLKCGECGRNYYGRKRLSGKDNSYICSSKRYKELTCCNKGILIPFLDELIWSQLVSKKLFIKAYQDFIANNDNDLTVSRIKKENNILEKTISSNKKKINKLLDYFIDNENINESLINQVTSKINSIQNNNTTLKEKRKNNLEDLKQFEKAGDSSIEDILNRDYLNPSFNVKKELIHLIVNNIIISFDKSEGFYFIEIIPKIKGMETIVYVAPFSKKYAIEINRLTIEDVLSIKKETYADINLFQFNINDEVDVKIRFDYYNYYLKNIKKKD